ncbi:MAG TPA: BolA family protein [Gammaproteobacteria bacterium]
MSGTRIERMRERLEAALQPQRLDIADESHKHVGHAGARDGRGHFACTIVSRAFENTSPLERHRMVYDALGDMMLTDIHALSIRAFTPGQLEGKNQRPH